MLLLAHYDTVWPVGSWPNLWRVDQGRAFGPGVYDMKGGLALHRLAAPVSRAIGLAHPSIEVLFNPDEEIGSPGTRSFIEEAARRADVVLVLEPSNLEGSLKLARKGSGEYVITIRGRSSHQGVEPENGVNAVIEAAHQVLKVLELEDLSKGTTVGPNVIHGGSVSNMVPDRAEIRVDVRAWTDDGDPKARYRPSTSEARHRRSSDQCPRRVEPTTDGGQRHRDGALRRGPGPR